MRFRAKAPSAFTSGRRVVLSLVLVAMSLLALAPAANAGKVVDRVVTGTTSTGAGEGLFDDPRGIAINYANVADGTTDPLGASTNGYVYVVDEDRTRVQVFDPGGGFKFMFGRGVVTGGDGAQICDSSEVPCKSVTTADDEEGEFDDPQGIAINQTTGHVYVWDRDNRRVQQFAADGTFIRAFGQDVASAASPDNTGTGFEICTSLCKAATSGAAGGQFATTGNSSAGIAVVPASAPNAGNVIVGDLASRRIQEFGPNGSWIRAWGWDVVVPGGTGEVLPSLNELQDVEIREWPSAFGDVVGGTYTLTFEGQTTPDIPYNASAAVVDAELEALSTVGAGNVVVAKRDDVTWRVEFTGPFAQANVTSLSGDGSDLSITFNGKGEVKITTPRQGGPNPGFEICTTASQCKAAANSAPLDEPGAFAFARPAHLAVDPTGVVYASDGVVDDRVLRFDSTKALPADLLRTPIDLLGATGTVNVQPTALAVDPTNGNLFVASSVPEIGVIELADPDGTPSEADRHYQGAGVAANGIALDHAGDDLYLTTSHRVLAADDDGSPPAIVTLLPPKGVGPNGAELSATINPNGQVPTSYLFQVSKNGIAWTDVGALTSIGTGTADVPVSATVNGLEANALYRVRIITVKGLGNGETVSAELTFLTDAPPPEVKTLFPRSYDDRSAVLAGSVNPNNLPTTYRFQYGETTAYGSTVPVPSASVEPGGKPVIVFDEVSGLEPETTYHYRILATNAEGTTTGDDVSFTTHATVPTGSSRAWEMMTPPFKALPQFGGHSFGGVLNNPAVGIPSLDGEKMMWANAHFPLSDEIESAYSGDMRLMRRTSSGWTFETRNTLPLRVSCSLCGPGESEAPTFARVYGSASSGDMETISYHIGSGVNSELLPSEGPVSNRLYTRRDGTGDAGWTGWLTNPKQQLNPRGSDSSVYVTNTADSVRFNDDGSAMARSWYYRDLADDPDTPLDEDPSDEQQLSAPSLESGDSLNQPGGSTVYLQRAETPAEMPSAPKDLVNECTGTGPGDATALPTRVGSGSSTDTIGTQSCWSSPGEPEATGTGTASPKSNLITSVDTASGSFEVGQLIRGPHIPSGTHVTAVGAGTLTLSAANTSAQVPSAVGSGEISDGSNTITSVTTSTGAFAVGQRLSVVPEGPFGPEPAVEATITAVGAGTLTIDATFSLFFSPSSAQLSVNELPSTSLEAESQHVTSLRGAVLGAGGNHENSLQHTQTALSNDGRRVFFQSPDNSLGVSLPATACTTATGPQSVCVPQLFVRQYDEDGTATVRWISRAQGVGAQRVAELGRGAFFEGASRDGRYVYFKTNSPLLPNDPNGDKSITTGEASDLSFDLYRYELPEDLGEDPSNGALTRVSGGPTGNADPSTNNEKASGGGFGAGGGGALRHLSDDGKLAYFVTTSPIAGADATPAHGAATTPGGGVGNGTEDSGTRNLYLFDDTGLTPKWRYLASLPFAIAGNLATQGGKGAAALNACASSELPVKMLGNFEPIGGILQPSNGNCFRGTPDGKHILFQTAGRLTGDDNDDASDVYLYDYERDELTRISAPPPGVAPYGCNGMSSSNITAFCNADLGVSMSGSSPELGTGIMGIAGRLANARGWAGGRYYNLAENPDGTVSVFFQSKSNLVPEDDDELGRHDVYEWREGKLTLMTPEFPEMPYWYSGSSLDGEDLFVNTTARLDPREIDEIDYDLYDLRVGGGFPYTPPPTPCDVMAHQCRSTAAPNPGPRNSASATFSGEGNFTSQKAKGKAKKRCAKGKVRSKGRCVKAKRKAKAKRANQSGRAGR